MDGHDRIKGHHLKPGEPFDLVLEKGHKEAILEGGEVEIVAPPGQFLQDGQECFMGYHFFAHHPAGA